MSSELITVGGSKRPLRWAGEKQTSIENRKKSRGCTSNYGSLAECRVLISRHMVYFMSGGCGTVSMSEVEKVQSLNSSIPEIQHGPQLKMALPGAMVSG